MERFVIIVNILQPLAIITKRPILDVAAVLDPPLSLVGHQKLSFENHFLYHLYQHVDFGLRDTNEYRIMLFYLDRKLQALRNTIKGF